MANRTGTYVAFDGLGKTDPSQSDYKYYATLQAWSANTNIDFKLVNSHEKTAAVRDTSSKTTLEARIRERLSTSKQMLIILSKDTRKTGSMLSYEIEKAVDLYKIPLIISYVGYNTVLDPSAFSSYWPDALRTRINNSTAKAIHIALKKDCILNAISQFSVTGKQLEGSKNYCSKETYKKWGLL